MWKAGRPESHCRLGRELQDWQMHTSIESNVLRRDEEVHTNEVNMWRPRWVGTGSMYDVLTLRFPVHHIQSSIAFYDSWKHHISFSSSSRCLLQVI